MSVKMSQANDVAKSMWLYLTEFILTGHIKVLGYFREPLLKKI